MGHKQTNHRGPKSTFVRCYSNSGQTRVRLDCPLCASTGGLLELHERNFRCLTYRALKGPLVVSWPIGLNASEPHLRAAYDAQWPVDGHRM